MAIASFNKVIIGGRLGRDREIHYLRGRRPDRAPVDRHHGAMDERQHAPGKTDWHTAALFKKSAVTFAERNVKKGDLVIVEGRLENRSYQKDGQTHHVTEVAVREGRGDVHLMAKASVSFLTANHPAARHSGEARTANTETGTLPYYAPPRAMAAQRRAHERR